MAEKQIVVFSLGEEEFAVEISMVREIVRMQAIRHIPGTPTFIEGIVNLRGNIVPIVDLRNRFGMVGHGGDREQRKIVIVNLENRQIGILVDGVTEILRISDESIEEAPEIVAEGIEQKYIVGVAKEEGRLIVILDMIRIFSSEEQAELKEVG